MKNTSVYYEEYISLTTIFTEKSIGNVCLLRFTTKKASGNGVFFVVNLSKLSLPRDSLVRIVLQKNIVSLFVDRLTKRLKIFCIVSLRNMIVYEFHHNTKKKYPHLLGYQLLTPKALGYT